MSNHHIPRHSGIYYFSSNATSGQRYNPDWLPQVSQSSLTKLHNTSSCTCVSQMFINPSNESPITSAKYTFPLYESCAVVSFRCYVGALVIDGIIKEKEEASARYQEAVDLRTSASLLEQHAPDVFSIGLGNVPPGETVKVEIEYIMELKHDAEIDGLRFTIPTSIAPRYGDPPSGLNMNEHSLEVAMKGINISVEITMPSNITSVQVCYFHLPLNFLHVKTILLSRPHIQSLCILVAIPRILQTTPSTLNVHLLHSARHPPS